MSCRETVLGWDVGGAHLKAVLLDADGAAATAVEVPCPLWSGMSHLDRSIDSVLARLASPPVMHALTMTGELADSFSDRGAGTAAITEALVARLPGRELRIYAGRRGFVPVSSVSSVAAEVASANWHATALYVATVADEALLMDVGSTTADLVPVAHGEVRAIGHDDFARLAAEELVYTGVTRTPLMSLAERAPLEGWEVGLMAEHFATTADVYRLTGELPLHADLHPTADAGPKTIEDSARRVARMVGRDAVSAPLETWQQLARFFAERQLGRLLASATRVIARADLSSLAPVVGAGVGAFLARKLAARLGRQYVDFSALAARAGARQEDVMACAPAFAVAHLLWASLRDAKR
jgi:probable H4MPT-linked C1 transfer pathway protein